MTTNSTDFDAGGALALQWAARVGADEVSAFYYRTFLGTRRLAISEVGPAFTEIVDENLDRDTRARLTTEAHVLGFCFTVVDSMAAKEKDGPKAVLISESDSRSAEDP